MAEAALLIETPANVHASECGLSFVLDYIRNGEARSVTVITEYSAGSFRQIRIRSTLFLFEIVI